MIDPELPEIGIRLSTANEEDGLTSDICHGERRANLVILTIGDQSSSSDACMTHYGIELGQDDAVNTPFPLYSTNTGAGEILEGSVKFSELVDSLVPDKGFAHEDDLVGVVDGDQLHSLSQSLVFWVYLGQCSHERFVVLHSPGCIDQDNVEAVLSRYLRS